MKTWMDLYLETTEKVLKKVDISADDLFWYRIEVANDYIKLHFPNLVTPFQNSAFFWQWWKQCCMSCDLKVLEYYEEHWEGCRVKAEQYKINFNAKTIKLFPNPAVMNSVVRAEQIVMESLVGEALDIINSQHV